MFFEDLQKKCTHKNYHYIAVGSVCTAVSVKKAELGGGADRETELGDQSC